VDNSTASQVNIVATAPRENVSSPGRGSISNFFFDFNTVETETLQNVEIAIQVNRFDDGIFIAINGVTVVEFNELGWLNVNGGNNLVNTTFGRTSTNFGSSLRWQPWFGDGDPAFLIDVTAGTVQLLVTDVNGVRQDILPFIRDLGVQNPTPNTVPTIDPEAGVTISTASSNVNNTGFIDVQTVTVSGEFGGLDDIDGDGIINSLDIDTDGDRIWDKYDVVGTDSDGIVAYRDTDSNGNGISDTVEASLTAADIAALEGGGTSDRVNNGTYTNGDFSSQFILLSDAGLTLDFTEISNTAFSDVEYIDMNDGAAQTITLALEDVLAMTSNNQLIIVGDRQDTVNAAGFELTTLQQSIQGEIFNIYALDDARLIIHEHVTVNLL
jgi:hypothetical protein